MPRMENQIKSEQRLVLVVKTGKWISKATMYSIDRRIGLAFILLFTTISSFAQQIDYTTFVDRFTGTGGSGGIVPVASMPFGMVQLGPDTRTSNTGYHYNNQTLLGFSHVHKSGAGCSDFQDILFLPLPANTILIA